MRRLHVRDGRGGFALLVVLLALLALLILCAPFLWTANKVDESAARVESAALARHGLDTAARELRHRLSLSHPSLDSTPNFDEAAEFDLDPERRDALGSLNEQGALWQGRAEDLAGRVDLSSASPQMIANLLGASTFLLAPLETDAKEITVADAGGFEPAGFLWIDGELVRYGSRTERKFADLTRGLLSKAENPCGPSPSRNHAMGTPVMAQEAWALAMWRVQRGLDRDPGSMGSGALEEAGALSLAGKLTAGQVARLLERGTFFGDVAAPGPWQRALRLLENVDGGTDCVLRVDEPRFVAAGSTLLLTQGDRRELALVRRVEGNGAVVLLDPVSNSFEGGEAQVRVLVARPVNANTARADVLRALFENVALAGRNERVTASEAKELATRVVLGRPWTGFGDLLERLILPAAGLAAGAKDGAGYGGAGTGSGGVADPAAAAFLSVDDALALYHNFEHSNDAELRYSTAPLAFVSRDVFEFELRSSHNAPSGLQRAFAERVGAERVAPVGPLLRLWTRQTDFDEELRVTRDAPGWSSGPASTSVFDTRYGASPPPRRPAHFPRPADDANGMPTARTPILPDAENPAWVQPWVARVDEEGQRAGRVLHFDREDSHPEGRLLSDGFVALGAADGRVRWLDDVGLTRPLSVSFWMQPGAFPTGGHIFDLGGTGRESDRVSLLFDGEDLVLRVLDAVGDHPRSSFVERAEVRFALTPGETPGMVADTWSHVELDVRGNRPEQMGLRIDGLSTARTPGLTRLAAALSSGDSQIIVESTEGFPETCVLRIGSELIEVRRTSATTFDGNHSLAGPDAGFGGRIAREVFNFEPAAAINLGLAKPDNHDAGAPVALYGYTLPLVTNAPPGSSSLQADLGAFAVGRVAAVEGANHPLGKEILIRFPQAGTASPGRGFEGGTDGIQGLVLTPADPGHTPEQVMGAFATTGGFAAILQQRLTFVSTFSGETLTNPSTDTGTPLFEVEVVRYSGVDGNTLRIAQWGIDSSTLPNLAIDSEVLGSIGGGRAFVVEWGGNLVDPGSLLEDLATRVLVVPISLPAQNSGTGFLPAQAGQSQFAQLTRRDDAEFTEWVRYDSLVADQLVRDDPNALASLWLAATRGIGIIVDTDPDDEDEEGGGGPGQGIYAPAFQPTFQPLPAAPAVSAAPSAPLAPAAPRLAGAYWQPDVGAPADDDFPLTRAARTAFQFRGVLGTYSHEHPSGTPILPVFALEDNQGLDPSQGRPGRLDHAFLVDADRSDPGWPVVVHRAYRPNNHLTHSWSAGPALTSTAGQTISTAEAGFDVERVYVAMDEALAVPIAFGALGLPTETRTTARLVLFPSGERPRVVDRLAFGSEFDGGGTGLPVVLDEVVFGGTQFGGSFGLGPAAEGAAMVLTTAMGASDQEFRVAPSTVRTALGNLATLSPVLGALTQDAGLVRIGEEWIAYSALDEASGLITVAPGGRGMLASEPQPHGAGETVHFQSHVTVGELTTAATADDADLALEDLTEFPSSGTVLVGDELVHFTARRNGALTMPRRASAPGLDDHKGAGLFRGRFGTVASSQPAGTPVVLFPHRYWDRFAEEADAPELHYFGFALHEPDAFLLRTWFERDDPPEGGATLAVLLRVDPSVPWDSEPRANSGLMRLTDAGLARGGLRLAVQTSKAEWRVYTEYPSGAFDASTGLPHGWKRVPRLPSLGVEFLAPGRVLSAQER